MSYTFKEIPGRGVGIVATKKINRGETIMTCDPFSIALEDDHIATHCSYCISDKDLTVCSGCNRASYCSVECRSKDARTHETLCKAFNSVELPDPLPESFRFELLSALHLTVLGDSEAAKEALELEGSINDAAFKPRKENFMARAEMFSAICSHVVTDAAALPVKKIADLLVKTEINSFSVLNGDFTPVGYGLYPAASRANHSCWPNADYICDGRRLRLVSTRDILPSEEVTICYVPLQPADERTERIRDEWGFACTCGHCMPNPGCTGRNIMDGLLAGLLCGEKSCGGEEGTVSLSLKHFTNLLLEETREDTSDLLARLTGAAKDVRSLLSATSNPASKVTAPLCPGESAFQPICKCLACGKRPSDARLALLQVADQLRSDGMEWTADEDPSDPAALEEFFSAGLTLRADESLLEKLLKGGVSPLHDGIQNAAQQVIKLHELKNLDVKQQSPEKKKEEDCGSGACCGGADACDKPSSSSEEAAPSKDASSNDDDRVAKDVSNTTGVDVLLVRCLGLVALQKVVIHGGLPTAAARILDYAAARLNVEQTIASVDCAAHCVLFARACFKKFQPTEKAGARAFERLGVRMAELSFAMGAEKLVAPESEGVVDGEELLAMLDF